MWIRPEDTLAPDKNIGRLYLKVMTPLLLGDREVNSRASGKV
jgi:hypothetical protein